MAALLNQTMWHYIAGFAVYTVAAVVVMYLIYFGLKKNPAQLARLQAMAGGTVSAGPAPHPVQAMMQARLRQTGQLQQSLPEWLARRLRPWMTACLKKIGWQPVSTVTGVTPVQPVSSQQALLQVESSQMLDTMNTVSVVSLGGDRFLLASGPQGVSLLQTLPGSAQSQSTVAPAAEPAAKEG